MSEKKYSIHLTIVESLHSALKERSFMERVPIVELARRAMRAYLNRAEDIDPLIPKGYYPVEAYMNDDGAFVLLGDPRQDDQDHNCDFRGCSSVGGHVIRRTHISEIRNQPDISEA
jgi:AMMECR1 domain-containing protein